MKKICAIGITITALLSSGLFFLNVDAAEKGNLLLNPGFEDKTDHMDYWKVEGNADHMNAEEWHFYEGKYAFGVGNDSDKAVKDASVVCSQIIRDPNDHSKHYQVKPGERVTFRMWMQAEEKYGGKASLKLEFFNSASASGKPIASYQSPIQTGTFEWLKETVSGVAPAGAVTAVVSCVSANMPVGPNYAFIWFDSGSVTVIQLQ